MMHLRNALLLLFVLSGCAATVPTPETKFVEESAPAGYSNLYVGLPKELYGGFLPIMADVNGQTVADLRNGEYTRVLLPAGEYTIRPTPNAATALVVGAGSVDIQRFTAMPGKKYFAHLSTYPGPARQGVSIIGGLITPSRGGAYNAAFLVTELDASDAPPASFLTTARVKPLVAIVTQPR